ncbi:hypothetical protein E2C01_074543 [Portunus trituberculatus]|uniref:Uncharacterized protein n=1 Tax=Portunus trituberculatus TaxID=210409 RepID=A0A5B7ICI5_PORTR|nr:hypothetical protein [Portunus trituberculatus]
MRKRWRSTSS